MFLQKVLFDVGIFRKSLKTANWWHIPLKNPLDNGSFFIPSPDSGIFSHP